MRRSAVACPWPPSLALRVVCLGACHEYALAPPRHLPYGRQQRLSPRTSAAGPRPPRSKLRLAPTAELKMPWGGRLGGGKPGRQTFSALRHVFRAFPVASRVAAARPHKVAELGVCHRPLRGR